MACLQYQSIGLGTSNDFTPLVQVKNSDDMNSPFLLNCIQTHLIIPSEGKS